VNASDEAGLVERMGHDVHVVLGSEAEYENHQAGGHGIGALLPGTRAAESLNMLSRSLTKTFFFWIGIGFISLFFLKLVLTNKNPAAGLAYSEFQSWSTITTSFREHLPGTNFCEGLCPLRGTQKYVETTIPSANCRISRGG